jgi:hypothetical protein
VRVFALSVFVLGGLTSLTGVVQAPEGDATAILAAARAALGGEKSLAEVRTFVATGRTRQVQGDNLVPIEFEISCEFPDKCIRRDEVPARESGPTTIGFSGDELIQIPLPPTFAGPPAAASAPTAGRSGTPPQAPSPPTREGRPPPSGVSLGQGGPTPTQLAALRVGNTKQDFARLWLGMFAASFSSFPVTFTRVGQAEAPQGQADVLEAKGPANFTARLFILKDTHLPIMLSWQGQALGKPVENRIYYADYRDVDGLKFPFRLRRAVGADTVEETTFDRFRINTRIDPRRFEVRK